MGYIYIIQTPECYNSIHEQDRKTFKIGMTGKDDPEDRLVGYVGIRSARIYSIMRVRDEKKCEDKLKAVFGSVFELAPRGKEYFVGDIDLMMKLFYITVQEYFYNESTPSILKHDSSTSTQQLSIVKQEPSTVKQCSSTSTQQASTSIQQASTSIQQASTTKQQASIAKQESSILKQQSLIVKQESPTSTIQITKNFQQTFDVIDENNIDVLATAIVGGKIDGNDFDVMLKQSRKNSIDCELICRILLGHHDQVDNLKKVVSQDFGLVFLKVSSVFDSINNKYYKTIFNSISPKYYKLVSEKLGDVRWNLLVRSK